MELIKAYFRKMKGGAPAPGKVPFWVVVWSWIGAFLGIALVGFLHQFFLAERELVMIIGSFGATAVLIYGAVESPLAQPRNLLGGHVISGFIGVLSYNLLGTHFWLAGAVAVATAIAVMHLTGTLHPPGGATALIAVIGGPKIHALGFLYPILPVATGALIMLVVALLVNNIPDGRKYPLHWF